MRILCGDWRAGREVSASLAVYHPSKRARVCDESRIARAVAIMRNFMQN